MSLHRRPGRPPAPPSGRSSAVPWGRPLRRFLGIVILLSASEVVTAPWLAATRASFESQPQSEPVLVPGVSTVLWRDDFDRATPGSAWLSSYVTLAASAIHRDSAGGLGGSGAVRFDWQTRAGCADDSRVLEHNFPPTRDVIVQYSVRYSPGFVFDWGSRRACAGNAKKLFFLWADSGSRFMFISENHELGMGSDYDHPLFPQNVGARITPEVLADGAWHRVTIRVRQSSKPLSRDGAITGWIDGLLKWQYRGIASHASGGWTLFKLPTTFNSGSPVNQSEWLDGLSIWRP